jgi:rhodanese-related sulfurtransferase
MPFTLIAVCVAVAVAGCVIAIWVKRRKKRDLELHSITPEGLHALLTSSQKVLLYDVRQPLDLLANSEMIPGATRIPPKDLLQDPSLIPRDKDSVVYCTCLGDETSRRVLDRAQAEHFLRMKFLKDGLAGWKAKGYPVVPYEESFHLDTRT